MQTVRPAVHVKFSAAVVIALAVALRCWQIGDLSLNHFDEGVLVSGAFGVWLNGPWHFPLAQPLQAPPLFPWMVAGMFWLTQTASPITAIYLSAVLGSATVAIYFALLRRLYGSPFAIVGAAVLAASDLHIAFSRMALTDVALTFWFVLGAYFLARMADTAGPPAGIATFRRSGRIIGWGVAFGLAAGAAWNTKYNGWMLIAIAATAWLFLVVRGWLVRLARSSMFVYDAVSDSFANLWVLLAIFVAGLVSVACFVPWYRHVEQTFGGGYAAVTANHWQYVGGLTDWPSRAARLWLSLTAFRHFGWVTMLLGLSATLLHQFARWFVARQPNASAATRAVLVGLALLSATFILGGDAVVVVIAAAALVPALIWGRWPEVLFAVWTAAFLIMTPFYHPYTRLLVPALPAAISLVMWIFAQALTQTSDAPAGLSQESVSDRGQRPVCALLATASLFVFLAALVWHPFGWVPSHGAWARWSARKSYRALGDALSQAHLPDDAVVLCQGPPAMTLYLARQWVPLEWVPFDRWLPRIERHRECYLAVDFWGLYAENHQSARASFVERLECLEPVASVPNDLNLPTLLDYLPAAEVARHLSTDRLPKQVADAQGRKLIVPAALDEPNADLILLYRIDRDCTDLLDRPHGAALQ